MGLFRSYRFKLQALLLLLGLVAIAITDWQASEGAVAALRHATYDRLTAIRETKGRLIEDYFADLNAHVLALSNDESTIAALEHFRSAWVQLPPLLSDDPRLHALRNHYDTVVRTTPQATANEFNAKWFPADPYTQALQHLFVSNNPHPIGSKDLLVQAASAGRYGDVHARYHPTLHRYQTAFGFYDIFLIDARDGRILYTVSKEIDLGARLTVQPYSETTLARAFLRARDLETTDRAVIEDYAPYVASHFVPAAFVAAPITRAGAKIGVLAIQVSVAHVNRVMTGDRRWQTEGMGRTGHAYIVGGADRTLRSDVRFEIEDPESFFRQIQKAGVPPPTIERIRQNHTAILNLALPEHAFSGVHPRTQGIEIAHDFRNTEVIRSHTRLDLPDLDWVLVAEMQTSEAFGPVALLRKRLLVTGLAVAAAFAAVAWLLGVSVTRPVLALLEGTKRLSTRNFDVTLPVSSSDEIGQLALSFNSMVERLKATSVSRDELDRANRRLEKLNHRLITAQEEERSRLGRELHDDLTQRLAAIAIEAGTLKQSAPSDLQPRVEQIQRHLIQISNDVHGLSRRLHSAILSDLGLIAAIEGECRGFFERGGPHIDFSHQGPVDTIPPDAQLALYRIVQEALRNAHRHADATEVTIQLERSEDAAKLDVRDNGHGFDSASAAWRPGLGLASMSERARLLGGTIEIQSAKDKGTHIGVHLPLGEPA